MDTADLELGGRVTAAGQPAAGVVVVVTDEGEPVATTTTGTDGSFFVAGLPEGGLVTVRAVDPVFGAATAVVAPPASVDLALTNGACQLFLDLPDPRWLVPSAFLESWDAEPLHEACPSCPAYRWFWERPGLTPVILRLDFTPDGVRSTVRAKGADGWEERTSVLSARKAARLDRALGLSGYWQLEHDTTAQGCSPGGSEWTIEALASPGYRAVYRVDPPGTPVAYLGREWARAAGLRVRRRDFR